MRVLAVDPGLTRCGVGVVDGVPGRKLPLVDVGVIRTPSGDPTPERLVAVEDEMRAVVRAAPPRGRGHRARLRRHQRLHRHGHRAGDGDRHDHRRAPRPAGHAAHPDRGQGRRERQRPGRQGAGDRDGDPPARARHPPKPADAADALALAICHVWRGGTQSRLEEARSRCSRAPATGERHTPRVPPSGATGAAAARRVRPPTRATDPTLEPSPDDRLALRHRPQGRPRLGRRRGRRRRHARAHDARAPPPSVRLGQPAELATSLVVREDSLTLYGFADRGREARLRDRPDRVRRRSAAGPGHARRARPDAVRVALGTGDLVALTKVPGHRQEGRRADRPRAARTSSAPCPARRGQAEPSASTAARPGASRCARPSSVSAGPRGRPTTPSTRSPRWPPRAPASRRCCAPPCRSSADERRPLDWELDTGADPEVWDDGSFDATARIVDAVGDTDERQVEAALRPKRLDDFPGQTRVREQLGLVLKAAKRRGTPPDHVLLSGPPGLGKTTLAMIVAGELEQPIRITSGPAIQHAGDLASVLSSLAEGEVLFLDEIHRMSRSAEEMLYLAMEDFRVDVIIGKGPGATAIPLELPPFTVVGATTRAGLLPAPLRDRFGFTGHLDYYAAADLVTILHRSARLLGLDADEDGIREIALRSRGTPRIANRLLRRVRDWAQVHGEDRVTHSAARAGARAVRRRRARPRPPRPCRPRGPLPPLQRRAGRALDPGRRRGRGARHRRDRRRALPGPGGLHGAHPARPSRVDASPGSTSGSPHRATRRRSGPPRCRSTRPGARVSRADAKRAGGTLRMRPKRDTRTSPRRPDPV